MHNRFDVIDREQLAAQIVAVMNAHFHRPDYAEKRHILYVAERQLLADQGAQQVSDGAQPAGSKA